MGKHSASFRFTGLSLLKTTAASSVLAATAATGLAAPAAADPMQETIEEMERISHEATAKAEEVKKIEGEIAKGQKEVDALRAAADRSRSDAHKAIQDRSAAQGDVERQALTQYRNLSSDARINALESANPQEAIDRAAYLGSLSRSAQRTLGDYQALNETAAKRATDADMALAVADYRQKELEGKRTKLDRERKELDGKVKEVERRVNSFNPDQRARWETKNGPVANVPPSAHGNGVVGSALSKVGAPYGWGSAGPDAFDCSGLMVWSYAQHGKSIPRTSQAQLAGGTPVPLSALQPGDIIGYYPGVTHVAMYIGDGQVVHASDYGIPVQVVPMNSMPVQGAVRY